GLPSRMRFIAFSASVLDAPVSSVASASFLPLMPPAALISSTANSVPLRAWVPSSAVLPVIAVVRPSGIGEGQLAGSAFDGPAEKTARQIAARPAIELFKKMDVVVFPVDCLLETRMKAQGLSSAANAATDIDPLLRAENSPRYFV